MNTTRNANRILTDAWLRIEIPTAITEPYEIVGLISDSVSGVLFRDAKSDRDRSTVWIKACNPHRERAALGFWLTGDELETLTPQEAEALLQYAVNIFLEQSDEFEEGGALPNPIRIALI